MNKPIPISHSIYYDKPMKMQIGEIRALPKSSSPMFTEQWAVQGTAKAPYIVSRKGGYKATSAAEAKAWQCSCKSWTTTVPRQDCKHVVSVKLKEGILKETTPPEWKTKVHVLPKPVGNGAVVLSKEEHEAYKKFQEARAASKSGDNFDEGRRFRP